MSPMLVILVVLGVIIGLIMGALPGLTVTMTAVLVVSLTFGWPMADALAFIIGAFCGGVMGGSISAIALNIPGTAAAVATVFDGHPMKMKGEADTALGIALFVSMIGGIFGFILLSLIGPLLGRMALKFGAQEYFLITLWGLTLVAVLSQGHFVKGNDQCLCGPVHRYDRHGSHYRDDAVYHGNATFKRRYQFCRRHDRPLWHERSICIAK
jgi:putative tricarboxylic transport membrane protein